MYRYTNATTYYWKEFLKYSSKSFFLHTVITQFSHHFRSHAQCAINCTAEIIIQMIFALEIDQTISTRLKNNVIVVNFDPLSFLQGNIMELLYLRKRIISNLRQKIDKFLEFQRVLRPQQSALNIDTSVFWLKETSLCLTSVRLRNLNGLKCILCFEHTLVLRKEWNSADGGWCSLRSAKIDKNLATTRAMSKDHKRKKDGRKTNERTKIRQPSPRAIKSRIMRSRPNRERAPTDGQKRIRK